MSKRIVKVKGDVELAGYEIISDKNIFYGKDKVNVSVTVDILVNGKRFSRTDHMWDFEVSDYLSSYGAEL